MLFLEAVKKVLSPKIPSQFQRRPAYLRRKKLPNAEEAEQVDEEAMTVNRNLESN